MKQIIKKSFEELNELLPKEKKLVIADSTPLIGEKSSLDSVDLVNLFVSLEKNKFAHVKEMELLSRGCCCA